MREHDVVELVAPVTDEGLQENAIGTVVHVYADWHLCEVEFVTPEGSKVVTLRLDQVREKDG